MKASMSALLCAVRDGRISESDLESGEPLGQALTKAGKEKELGLLKGFVKAAAEKRWYRRQNERTALLDELIAQQEAWDAAHPEAADIDIDVSPGWTI